MANIEITPINIDGVKLPFNLLDNLLGQKIDYTRLVYPMDLATNPQYCHAVQFSVHDYEYPVVEGYYNQLSNQFNNAASAVGGGLQPNVPNAPPITGNDIWNKAKQAGSAVVGAIGNLGNNSESLDPWGAEASQALGGIMNYNLTGGLNGAINAVNSFKDKAPGEIKQYFTKYGPLIQTDSYKPRIKDNPLAYISLYMPDTLQTQVNSHYDDVSLTDTFKIAGYAGNAIADTLANKETLKSNPGNILTDDYRRGLVGVGAGAFNENLGRVLGNALKRVPNPQLQLMYRGLDLRSFAFDFTFTPSSAKEAQEIDEIIKTFTYYSLPDVTSGAGGQFFIPPQIFRIKFAFLGSDGVAGQIYDVFRSNLTNVLGNQFTKILSGSNPTNDITNAKTAKIFEINDCVLTDVQVNYAPNGWAAYGDGWPIQTTLSLTFKEMQVINKKSKGVQPTDISSIQSGSTPDVKTMFSKNGGKTLTDIAGGNLSDYLYGGK